jgi:hypothetical protein
MQQMQQQRSMPASMTMEGKEQQLQQLILLPAAQHDMSMRKQENSPATWTISSSYHKHQTHQPHQQLQRQYQQQPQHHYLHENQQVQLQGDQHLQQHQDRRFVQPSTQYSQRQIINVDVMAHDQRLDELNSARIEPWIYRRSIGNNDVNLTRIEPWHNQGLSVNDERNVKRIEPWINR